MYIGIVLGRLYLIYCRDIFVFLLSYFLKGKIMKLIIKFIEYFFFIGIVYSICYVFFFELKFINMFLFLFL